MAKRYQPRHGAGKSPTGTLLILFIVLALLIGGGLFVLSNLDKVFPSHKEEASTSTSTTKADKEDKEDKETTKKTTKKSKKTTTEEAETTKKSKKTTTEVTTTKKSKKTTVESTKYTDRYIDDNGMLQFKPSDRYVQSTQYSDPDSIPWNLLLVNDWNPMQEGYDRSVTMKLVENRYAQVNPAQMVDARMYEDLIEMLNAGSRYNIGVQSSYRSFTKQKDLYWRQVDSYRGKYSDPIELQSQAGEVVKRPGFSEHNSGLAVDLYGSGDTSLSASFADTDAYDWLMENCADYGFILRFPEGKESITGVIYEAWHFRYVGDPDIAHEIMDNGLCLEEYLEQVKK